MSASLQRTPLHAIHRELGGRLIEFGGWDMPVQYTGIVEEHLAVRQKAGLFDIAHMGEVFVRGPAAQRFLNSILTNDISRLEVGQAQYTLLCNQNGGTVDDLYAYRLESETFLLIINASRIHADVAWLNAQWHQSPLGDQVHLESACAAWGALAIQGPAAATIINRCTKDATGRGRNASTPTALKKNEVAEFNTVTGPVWIARTGYTGEDGFELIARNEQLAPLWKLAMDTGQPCGLRPAGLGARDTLRTEMGYPLYGHELDESTSPIEAGLSFFVAFDKGPFVGRDALLAAKQAGPSQRSVAFRMNVGCPPPRPHYSVFHSSQPEPAIGTVTSGTQSPSLQTGIGLAKVPTALAHPDTSIQIEIRGRLHPATIVKRPIYRKPV